MKKTITWTLATLLLVLCSPARAVDIQSYHSGSWFESDRPGHGFSLQVLHDERLVIYWFSYHPDGTPMWLLSVADIKGDTAIGDAFYYSGMPFGTFDPVLLQRKHWGTLSVRFQDCYSARLSYDSELVHGDQPFGSGQIDLTRLTFIDGMHCYPPLEDGKFGNFTSGYEVPSPSGFPANNFAWILRDGTLAYQFASDRAEDSEIGYGRLAMTGEFTFEFEAVTSNGVRESTGMFSDDRVILDLNELGVLSEPLDPVVHDSITYPDIAGMYFGPDAMWGGTIDMQGKYEGWGFGASSVWGDVTIAEPELNQLAAAIEWDSALEGHPGGRNQGLGIYDKGSGNLFFIFNRDDYVWAAPWYRGD